MSKFLLFLWHLLRRRHDKKHLVCDLESQNARVWQCSCEEWWREELSKEQP